MLGRAVRPVADDLAQPLGSPSVIPDEVSLARRRSGTQSADLDSVFVWQRTTGSRIGLTAVRDDGRINRRDQPRIWASSTASGSEPFISTLSWKARRSKPGLASASARSRAMTVWPTL